MGTEIPDLALKGKPLHEPGVGWGRDAGREVEAGAQPTDTADDSGSQIVGTSDRRQGANERGERREPAGFGRGSACGSVDTKRSEAGYVFGRAGRPIRRSGASLT